MCLSTETVSITLLQEIYEGEKTFNQLYDNLLTKIKGQYYFTSACSFSDMVDAEIAFGNMSLNGKLLRITEKGKRLIEKKA
ncbi:MAG: hypothetical protein HFJ84_10890 [Clostridiales bacterium]|jgi:hypothetical protein|nr:hypothetical protein [Clostridiales bacterium]